MEYQVILVCFSCIIHLGRKFREEERRIMAKSGSAANKYDILRKLTALEAAVSEEAAREIIDYLSEHYRSVHRIIITERRRSQDPVKRNIQESIRRLQKSGFVNSSYDKKQFVYGKNFARIIKWNSEQQKAQITRQNTNPDSHLKCIKAVQTLLTKLSRLNKNPTKKNLDQAIESLNHNLDIVSRAEESRRPQETKIHRILDHLANNRGYVEFDLEQERFRIGYPLLVKFEKKACYQELKKHNQQLLKLLSRTQLDLEKLSNLWNEIKVETTFLDSIENNAGNRILNTLKADVARRLQVQKKTLQAFFKNARLVTIKKKNSGSLADKKRIQKMLGYHKAFSKFVSREFQSIKAEIPNATYLSRKLKFNLQPLTEFHVEKAKEKNEMFVRKDLKDLAEPAELFEQRIQMFFQEEQKGQKKVLDATKKMFNEEMTRETDQDFFAISTSLKRAMQPIEDFETRLFLLNAENVATYVLALDPDKNKNTLDTIITQTQSVLLEREFEKLMARAPKNAPSEMMRSCKKMIASLGANGRGATQINHFLDYLKDWYLDLGILSKPNFDRLRGYAKNTKLYMQFLNDERQHSKAVKEYYECLDREPDLFKAFNLLSQRTGREDGNKKHMTVALQRVLSDFAKKHSKPQGKALVALEMFVSKVSTYYVKNHLIKADNAKTLLNFIKRHYQLPNTKDVSDLDELADVLMRSLKERGLSQVDRNTMLVFLDDLNAYYKTLDSYVTASVDASDRPINHISDFLLNWMNYNTKSKKDIFDNMVKRAGKGHIYNRLLQNANEYKMIKEHSNKQQFLQKTARNYLLERRDILHFLKDGKSDENNFDNLVILKGVACKLLESAPTKVEQDSRLLSGSVFTLFQELYMELLLKRAGQEGAKRYLRMMQLNPQYRLSDKVHEVMHAAASMSPDELAEYYRDDEDAKEVIQNYMGSDKGAEKGLSNDDLQAFILNWVNEHFAATDDQSVYQRVESYINDKLNKTEDIKAEPESNRSSSGSDIVDDSKLPSRKRSFNNENEKKLPQR